MHEPAHGAEEEPQAERHPAPNRAQRLFVASLALTLATVTFVGLWWGFRLSRADQRHRISGQADPRHAPPKTSTVLLTRIAPYPLTFEDVATGVHCDDLYLPASATNVAK